MPLPANDNAKEHIVDHIVKIGSELLKMPMEQRERVVPWVRAAMEGQFRTVLEAK